MGDGNDWQCALALDSRYPLMRMPLPRPYYQDGSCTIYLADCRTILPLLPKVDLVLTDPPYGIDFQSAWRTEWQRKPKIFGDHEFPTWIFDIKPRIGMFVCCRWDNLKDGLPQPKSLIVWDKCRHGMGDLEHEFGRQWEGIAFYPGDEHRFLKRPIDIIRVPCVPPCDLTHPNEKPPEMWTPIIASHSGNLIMDPFMGVGSSLIASKDLGRKAIGIEIEERYCEIAAKRLAQEVLPLETSLDTKRAMVQCSLVPE